MKVLVTTGSTITPIDRVRALTNIFKGRTGTDIAQYFTQRSLDVTLLTSSPHLLHKSGGEEKERIRIKPFSTFDDLKQLMRDEVMSGEYDIIIHSAAVSDFSVCGVYTQEAEGLRALEQDGKISSTHESLYLKLVRNEKLIDCIRSPWGFTGTLVKFKLEIGLSDQQLLLKARASMEVSSADVIIANCLEWAKERAFIIRHTFPAQEVSRRSLPEELYRSLV